MSEPIRVAIIDDHPLYREGVAAALAAAVGVFDVVGQGSSASDAVAIARRASPHLMLLDVRMPGDGVWALAKISVDCPAIRLVALTVSEEEAHVSTAMRAGAAGYVLKGIAGSELVRILRDVHAGARYVSPTLAARILMRQSEEPMVLAVPQALTDLTPRERQIMGEVARGRTNKEVARALNLTEKTVKHYMTSIMQKLNVRNRMEAVLIASGKSSEVR